MNATLTKIKAGLDEVRSLVDTYSSEAEALLPKDKSIIESFKSALDTADGIADSLSL